MFVTGRNFSKGSDVEWKRWWTVLRSHTCSLICFHNVDISLETVTWALCVCESRVCVCVSCFCGGLLFVFQTSDFCLIDDDNNNNHLIQVLKLGFRETFDMYIKTFVHQSALFFCFFSSVSLLPGILSCPVWDHRMFFILITSTVAC